MKDNAMRIDFSGPVSYMEGIAEQFRSLFRVAEDKRDALVHQDNGMLTEVIMREEKILGMIQLLQNQRLEAVKEILTVLKINSTHPLKIKTSELMRGRAEEPEIEHARALEQEIRELAGVIKYVNEKNLFLISIARKFAADVLFALVGQHRKPMVDKKV